MTRIIHSRKKCIGCAYCVEIAPAFWRINDKDGRCELIGSSMRKEQFVLEIFEDELTQNKMAADLCPTKCILIE